MTDLSPTSDLSPASERILRALILTPVPELTEVRFQRLADRTGLSHATVKRHVKELRILGFIETIHHNGKALGIVVSRHAYKVLAHDAPSLS